MDFNFNLNNEKETPFQAGIPLSPEKFRGRHDSLNKILRYVKNASKCQVQHFFLTGERGIGKTSLIKFASNYIEKNWGMTGVYVSNKGNDSLNKLIDEIISALLEKIPRNIIKEKVKDLFGNVESLEIKDTKIKFVAGKKNADFMSSKFPSYLNELIDDINHEKGVFLVIDDINGLSNSKEFVDWYKKFSDTIEVNKHINLKLYVLFAGYSETFDNLVSKEPSFGRIFHFEELDALNEDDVSNFFIDTFELVDMECKEDSLEVFNYFSLGLPLLMQQIGESSFWLADNNEITKDVALEGVKDAANVIGNKQLRSILNIVSEYNYESILLKLCKEKLFSFKKDDVFETLSDFEKELFNKFLEDMVELDILSTVGFKEDGVYRFNNKLFYSYFMIKAH